MKLSHRLQPAFYAHCVVHIILEPLVQRIDAETDTGIGECPDKFHVPKHKVGFRLDADFNTTAFELLKQCACPAVFFLLRIVWVRHRADKQLLALVFLRIGHFRPMLHVQKLAPRFGMVGKAFHERGITILARMSATHIRIDGIVAYR